MPVGNNYTAISSPVEAQLKSSIYDVVNNIQSRSALQSMYDYVLYIAQRTNTTNDMEADLGQLLSAFNTDEISLDEIDKECECIRQTRYEQGRQI